MEGLFELEGEFLPEPVRVLAFEGREALNQCYEFHIVFTLLGDDAHSFDLDSATGKSASLSIHGDSREETASIVYQGTVAALELLDDREEVSFFRIRLVPKLWQLGLGEHSRVFVDQTLPDIIKEVLEAGGLQASDYELRFSATYPVLTHVCQYRESRLSFITRWLERVGAFYYFEHGDEQAKLIIADSVWSHEDCLPDPVRFVPSGEEDGSAGEALRTFRVCHAVQPRQVWVADYDAVHPQLEIAQKSEAAPYKGGREVRLFNRKERTGEGAAAHAKARALGYLCHAVTYRASGRVLGLVPGYTFELDEHPRAQLNQKYLVTNIVHRGWDPAAPNLDEQSREYMPTEARRLPETRDAYHCELGAVVAEEGWTPRPTAPWPRITGTVRATVDGTEASDYAQLDEHGRYLVRILFDESELPDGRASERIRMLQPHAGDLEAHHFPLRKGTEVQIAFIKGDPDQPVIAGVTPTAINVSPVTQPNQTRSVVQTGSRVRLEIEDQEGSEYIDVSSPAMNVFCHLGAHGGLGTHNSVLSTDGDYKMHTGTNRDILVEGDQSETVLGNLTESYESNQCTTVDGSLTETIDGGSTQVIQSGATQTIDGGVTQTITGGENRAVKGGQTETLSGGRTQTITGSSSETISASLTQIITGGATISTPGEYNIDATGGFNITSPATVDIIAPAGFNLLAPGGQTRLDGTDTGLGENDLDATQDWLTLNALRADLIGAYIDIVKAMKADAFVLKRSQGAKAGAFALAKWDAKGACTIVGAYKKARAALDSE